VYFDSEEGPVQVTDPENIPAEVALEGGQVIVAEGLCAYETEDDDMHDDDTDDMDDDEDEDGGGSRSFEEVLTVHALLSSSGLLFAAAECEHDLAYASGVRRSSRSVTELERNAGVLEASALLAVLEEVVEDACWLPFTTPEVSVEWPDLSEALAAVSA